MHPDRTKTFLLMVVLIAALAGCAGKPAQTAGAPVSAEGSVLTIEASSYKFSPKEIHIEKPGTLPVEIKNISGSQHNFTLRDSRGKVLKSVDIRPHTSVISNLELPEPGTYEFFCDKTFHTTLGMKGRIVVGKQSSP